MTLRGLRRSGLSSTTWCRYGAHGAAFSDRFPCSRSHATLPSRAPRRVLYPGSLLDRSANVQPHRGRPGLLATMTRLSSTPLSSSSRRASTRTSASQVAGAAVPGGSTDGVPGEPGFWALGGFGRAGQPMGPATAVRWLLGGLVVAFWLGAGVVMCHAEVASAPKKQTQHRARGKQSCM